MATNQKLDFWIANNRNVLFRGKHGVGKTAKIKAAFDRAGLNWRYFSAATMDPWVDFIGVPKSVIQGDQEVLELIRPKDFANDEVEAIFFDEFNRSHKKIRNAVMELLQFKSINGRKFENLRMIWAAINPDDDDSYDVEQIDPAQLDRFQVQIDIPYKCDPDYFIGKYGKEKAVAAMAWWNTLPDPEKDKVSPRRLDYALDEALVRGDLRDILPASSNVSKLITTLQIGPIDSVIRSFMTNQDADGARKFLKQENNYAAAIDFVLKREDRMKFFLPLIDAEKLAALFPKQKKVLDFVVENSGKFPEFARVLTDVYKVSKNRRIKERIEKLCESLPKDSLPESLSHLSNATDGVAKSTFGKKWQRHGRPWATEIEAIKQRDLNTTYARRSVVREIEQYLPPDLTIEEALKTLTVLDTVAKSSYRDTLKRLPSFIPLANHCCEQLHAKTGVDVAAMTRKYSKYIYNIRRRLQDMGKSKQFFMPI